MKKSWKCVIVLLIVVLMLACAIAGCSDFGDRILCAESYTCEYGELFTTPYVTATTGIEAKVEIFDAEGNTVPVEYDTCSLDKGEYKIVFTAGELTKEVPLYCVDTKAPQIKVTYSASAAVGHWYTLPKANVSDISLVDKNLTIVELFKAGEDTPVASGVGSRFRIEDAEYYVLRVTATDTEGNTGYIEKKISVHTRPESEVLQDFSEDINAYHERTWGYGKPSFQWLEEFDGRKGVIAMGVDGSMSADGEGYAWWTNLGMDNIDLAGATGFTIKLRASGCRSLSIKPSSSDNTIQVYGSHASGISYVEGEWVEVYVSLVNADKVYTDLSNATVAFAIAPKEFYKDTSVWIDEIIVHYTPYKEYTLTVVDGTHSYAYDTIPAGRTVAVEHDDSKTPAGKVFSHYLCNGQRVWGNIIAVNENLVLTPVYIDLVTEEKEIPEGAVLVTDFSNRVGISGTGGYIITEWYQTYEGAAGVLSIGLKGYNENRPPKWSGILPIAFDFTPYTHVIFRMMVNKDALSIFGIMKDDAIAVNLLDYVSDDMVWIDVKIPVTQLHSLYFSLVNADGQVGEMVWFDQIFVTVE